MKEEILIGCLIIFLIFLMALMPPFAQFKSGVNNGAFRQIKIRKLSFLFRAPNGISVSKEGIALPLFILQVAGYVMALLCAIFNILMLVLIKEPLVVMITVTIVMFGVETIFIIIFITILGRITYAKRDTQGGTDGGTDCTGD